MDSRVSPYALVAIVAQSVHSTDRTGSAAPEPVGAVLFQITDRSVGASIASPIAFERLLRDQVIRGTRSIGCGAAEDADGIEPG